MMLLMMLLMLPMMLLIMLLMKLLRMRLGSTAASSSISSSSSHVDDVPETKYDVFISFRGKDIRDNFLSHMLRELRRESINVFEDDRLNPGDEISSSLVQAIEESSISLVIFSKDYASSRCCMEELLTIIECMEHHQRIVIPVFYHVDPSDVRLQKGSFAEVFCEHEKKFEKNVVNNWRSALKKTANLSGFHYPSKKYQHEYKFIEEIVNYVSEKLGRIFSCEEIKGLVGIDKQIEHIESSLAEESKGVQILCIWGMNGIGKTTIADVVFRKYATNYEGRCFLRNVREESEKHGGLDYLLQKLVSDLLQDTNIPLGGLSTKQSENVKRRLGRKKVFIVLDDVDSPEQLEHLIEGQFRLRPGSKVIVTTRDKHILKKAHQVYEVQKLNIENSMQLFCLNAFNKTRPEKCYDKLSEMAVHYANGIPLALKVLGSSLRSRSIEVWESALDKLKSHPNMNIFNVLKLSYDKLEILEKDIFLDIAFFFKGKKKNEVISILHACGFYPVVGIDKLERKALITISRDNKIEMHDLIEQMGWEVVLQESIEDPGKRSRLRNTEEVYNVLKNNKGRDSIEGILLDLSQISRDLYLQADTFKKMPMLRILKVYYSEFFKRSSNVYLTAGLESFSDELRYLEWDGYPLKCLPSSFCAEQLVELRMPKSQVSKLWDGMQDFVNLEIIDLQECRQLEELPDFTEASKLREIHLSFCESLRLVHPSILRIHTLEVLRLNHCIRLKSLEGKIHFEYLHDLTVDHCSSLVEFSVTSEKIRSLDLSGTKIDVLHSSIVLLSKLEELILRGLRITSLPFELCALTSLKKLGLSGCIGIIKLPYQLCFLTSLEVLDLSGCRKLIELLRNIKALTRLTTLRIDDCTELQYLPKLPSSITALYADNCTSLKTVFSIEAVSSYNLRMFSFQNCMRLDEDSLSGFMKVVHDTMMRCAIGDILQRQPIHKEGDICYPGSKVPEWFKYKTTEASISLQLDRPDDHLLGFFLCFVIPPLRFGAIECQFYLGDDERGRFEIPLVEIRDSLISNHVYIWYHGGNETLDAIEEYRAQDHCTTHGQKISLELTIKRRRNEVEEEEEEGDEEEEDEIEEDEVEEILHRVDAMVKGCGVHPIYFSDIRDFIEKFDDKYKECRQLVLSRFKKVEQERSLSHITEFVGGAALSSVLNVLFDKLLSTEVVNWIKEKKLEQKLLGRLKPALYAVQAFLNDAEKRQIKERPVKDWLDCLKDAILKADDLLDEVSTKAATRKDHGNFLSRLLNSQDRKMVDRMEDIIDTLDSIVNQKEALGSKEIPKENLSWRITTSLVETSDVIGRNQDKEAITELLLDDTSDGKISVIPIVGMGGIGKTTLAQLVYNDQRVKQYFDFQAWVCVSEEFDVLKVTRTVIEAIPSSSCDMKDLNMLQHELKEKLSRKRFLIVLDDAWNENYGDWNILLKPFKNGVKGSKIILTTRNRNVASLVQTVPPHELSLLSHEECWEVFAKHAFLSTKSMENPTLEKIGKDIANKCNGLPLAAQTLGGLLHGNHDVRSWNHVLKSEIWNFKSCIMPALQISYYYLPSYLKECFVYCSLYPKDFQFDKEELILLWMAENFLHPSGVKTLEEVGHEYFDQLVSRSFFQPHGTINGLFVMHDLMHDLATFYAGYFYFRAEELENAPEIDIKARHLSHNAKGNYPISKLLASCGSLKHTRTFLEINLDPWIPFNMENAPCILLSNLKCLRVLSFKEFPLDSLPDSIGELIHLRYLDLSSTQIVVLPESLSNLHNLQTLKLGHCPKLKLLPIGMQDLVNLRHLDIRGTCLKEMPKGMSKLKHLQVLSDFIVGKHEENGIKELAGLANLRGSLSISELQNVINIDQASKARMDDKKLIDDLQLTWSSSGDIADSQTQRDILHELRPHVDLKELRISGYRGTIFPNWLGNSSYHNMTQVYLSGCKNCCMLPSLGQLPSLKYLEISHFDWLEIVDPKFYMNDECCLLTPFPSLETLSFNSMPFWKEWNSPELDAFPRLKVLRISGCPMLTGALPNQLSALETLKISRCEQLHSFLPRAPAIKQLRINGKNKVRLGKLPLSLHSLVIEGSHLVEPVLKAITQRQLTCLQDLYIGDCSSAISFPVGCLPASLQSLTIKDVSQLEFQFKQQHESLKRLSISGCDSLTSFSLDDFPNLTGLKICRCENMKSLEVSRSLSCLCNLIISDCTSMVSFSALGMFAPQLERLAIRRCPELDLFPNGDLPPNMRDLHISHNEKLMSFLSSMNSHGHCLTHLEIYGEWDGVMTSFPEEGLLPASLESLQLSGFQSLVTLDCKGLVHLTSLQKLTILHCPKLENVAGERLPASLIRLNIYASPLLEKRCEMKDPQIWPKISHICGIRVDSKWIFNRIQLCNG